MAACGLCCAAATFLVAAAEVVGADRPATPAAAPAVNYAAKLNVSTACRGRRRPH
ncbi:hypothetical protein ACTMU2_36835 [Cupriavidus basilensis]